MKSPQRVGIPLLTVVLLCFSVLSRANEFQKPVPEIQIKTKSNGQVNHDLQLLVDKGGSTGAVSWSVTAIGDGAAMVQGNELALQHAGTVELKVEIAEDANFAAASRTKLIYIYETDLKDAGQAQIWGTMKYGGAGNAGVVFRMNANGSGYSVMSQLATDPGGASPFYGRLNLASDGKIYSTMPVGGKFAEGVLYVFDPANGSYTVLHHFDGTTGSTPSAQLLEATDGYLYGTTQRGGTNTGGTLYRFDKSNNTLTVLHNFSGADGIGSQSGVVQAANGNLYGTTLIGGTSQGTIYEYDIDDDEFQVRHYFSQETGGLTYAPLTKATNGKLYGITTAGPNQSVGVIYEFDPTQPDNLDYTIKYEVQHTDLRNSLGGFTQESPDGLMYTSGDSGGANNRGAIVSYVPGATTITKVKDFTAESGSYPYAATTLTSTGKLYGLLSASSTGASLTLYEYTIATGAYSIAHSFVASEGVFSGIGVIEDENGVIYGAANGGGLYNAGTIFSYDPAEEEFKVERHLSYSTEGASPSGGIAVFNNKLYTTSNGGLKQYGVVQEFDIATNVITRKTEFSATLGTTPFGFMKHSNNKLYTVNRAGGANSVGSIAQYDPATGQLINVASMPGYPIMAKDLSMLTEGADGKLYGIANGGPSFTDVIFSVDPADDHKFVVEHEFGPHNEEGSNHDGFVLGTDNKLYGTASNGGPLGFGLIFSFDPVTGDLEILHNFDSNNNLYGPPRCMILGDNGKMYGVLSGNFNETFGGIYEFDPENSDYEILYYFESDQIGSGRLTKGNAGNLIGFTISGGNHNFGYIFEFNPGEGDILARTHLSRQTGYSPEGLWLTVKTDQEITFTVEDKTVGDEPFDFQATSTSDVPITYSTTSDKITIDGSEATIVAAGRVTVTAEQAETDFYNSTSDEQTFCINPAKPTVLVPESGAIVLSSSAAEGNQWYKDGTAIDGATGVTYTATADGTYTVQATADDCVSAISDGQVIVIAGVEDIANLVRIYPNPVTKELLVDLPNGGTSSRVSLMDILGRPIESRIAQPNTTQRFEVGHLPTSMYIVRIAQDGRMISKVFMKQ